MRGLVRFSVGALLCVAAAAFAADGQWNVGDDTHVGQTTIYGRSMEGSRQGLPIALGDFNGDGHADVIITPMNADSGPQRERRRAGEAIVVLSQGPIGGVLDLAQLNDQALPSTVTVIYGADVLDFLGTEVFTGDVNGDGYDDAIIGAQYGDGPGNMRANCGEVVILWGGPTVGGRTIDLAALQPDDPITIIYGASSGDRLGVWEGAGDFDGDGITDVVLGADQVNGPDGQRTHSGATYVLYGGPALRAASTIDLATTQLPLTRVFGIDPEDHSGCTVRAFDLNADGAAELLIGAGLNRLSESIGPDGNAGTGEGIAGGDGPNNMTPQAGEAYVIYGQVGVRPGDIDLRDTASRPASMVIIYGIDANDAYGEELYAGDFNGDGYGDIVIGALSADGPQNTRPNAGETALIMGGPTLPGSTILLSTHPSNVTFFYGPAIGTISGDTVWMADLDKDGKDDLLIGTPMDAPGGRFNAGTVSIFYGTDAPLPGAIDLAAPPPDFTPFVLAGGTEGDIIAYSASRGEVDGDGFTDIAVNAMGADGLDDLIDFAGDVYIISGFELSQAAGRVTSSPTPTPNVTPTATVTPTVAPCAGDCNADRTVSTDELIRVVDQVLSSRSLSDCPAADADHDGVITVADIVAAVAAALHGCL